MVDSNFGLTTWTLGCFSKNRMLVSAHLGVLYKPFCNMLGMRKWNKKVKNVVLHKTSTAVIPECDSLNHDSIMDFKALLQRLRSLENNQKALESRVGRLETDFSDILVQFGKLIEAGSFSMLINPFFQPSPVEQFAFILTNEMSDVFRDLYKVGSGLKDRRRNKVDMSVSLIGSLLESLPLPFFQIFVRCITEVVLHLYNHKQLQAIREMNGALESTGLNNKNILFEIAHIIASLYSVHILALTPIGMQDLVFSNTK